MKPKPMLTTTEFLSRIMRLMNKRDWPSALPVALALNRKTQKIPDRFVVMIFEILYDFDILPHDKQVKLLKDL